MSSSIESNSTRKKACAVCGEEFSSNETTCPTDGTVLTVISQELASGTVLADRYEIIQLVAGGGMGAVYKARHKLMKRTVAIKTLQPHLVASGAALRRFQQESEALSKLNHPNVSSVFDFFITEDGQPYLVMDYLEGTNLEDERKKGPMTAERAIPIFMSAAAGFQHAHDSGIIHRDIKPSNIMLIDFAGQKDFVKIIDFGIAKLNAADGEHAPLTSTGDVFGSPQFMSPEQCRGKKLDNRSDIYSLGCVMYTALTGVAPFSGQDQIECMFKQVHESPRSLEEVEAGKDLCDELKAIVMKALDKEPDNRFQSMEELREALLDVPGAPIMTAGRATTTGTKPVIAASGTPSSTETAAPDSSPHSTTNEARDSVPQSDKRQLSYSVSIAVGVVLAIGALVFFSGNNERKDEVSQAPLSTSKSKPSNTQKQPASHPMTATATSTSPSSPHKQTKSPPRFAWHTGPRYQPTGEPHVSYERDMSEGKAAFNRGSYGEAQRYFKQAHDVAGSFGEGDPRYVQAIYWQGMVALKKGDYVVAKNAFEWVKETQQERYGKESSEVKETQKQLDLIDKILDRKKQSPENTSF